MAEHYKQLHPLKFYRDYLTQNLRPDGRDLSTFRPVIVNLGSISTADGSAICKIGRTTVICGIKSELCKPKPERPKEGFIIPNVELPPLCSAKFKPGPPSDQAQVYTQLIADILENSQCLNLTDLCIYPDKLSWILYADLICLDFDGSVIDACVVALVAALKTVKLPMIEYDPVLDNKQVLEEKKSLQIKHNPIATSFAIFDDKYILVDSTVDEENLCTGVLTIVITNEELCMLHKPGGSPLSDEQLMDCIEKSKKRTKIIEQVLDVALNSLID